jgi:hypothetical protein
MKVKSSKNQFEMQDPRKQYPLAQRFLNSRNRRLAWPRRWTPSLITERKAIRGLAA